MRHHSLTLEKFFRDIEWTSIRHYLKMLSVDHDTTGLEFTNSDEMKKYLVAPENSEIKEVILEDFREINDIAEYGMPNLVRACEKYNIKFGDNDSAAQIAMDTFLNDKDAFEFAWSRYLFSNSTSRLSIYPVTIDTLKFTEEKTNRFKEILRSWYADLAKGHECDVSVFEDQNQKLVLIRHGLYLRTHSYWESGRVGFRSFRPVVEDILLYDRESSQLQIKASYQRDREKYLSLFCSEFAENEELVVQAIKGKLFSLEPLRNGKFDFTGSGPIVHIDLVKMRIQLKGKTRPEIELKSKDVMQALENDVKGLNVPSGTVTLARFCFHLELPGQKRTTVTFEIQPPQRTDLTENRHAGVIFEYLKKQGIMLG